MWWYVLVIYSILVTCNLIICTDVSQLFTVVNVYLYRFISLLLLMVRLCDR